MAMIQVKQEFIVSCISLYQYLIHRGNITAEEQSFIDALAATHFINRAHIESYQKLNATQGGAADDNG